MAGVFISYRREDSPGHAGRLFDRVRARFGDDTVFMDVTAIDAGVDFVEAIDRAVGTCDVLLAVIGPQWAGAADHAGRKRLDNPKDFIRLEIAGALKRNVRVVPVLVDDAQLPAEADLPEDLQPLLRRNAVELRDARWDTDVAQLIASLERIVKGGDGPLWLGRPPQRPRRTVASLLAVLALLAVGVGAAVVFGLREWAPALSEQAEKAAPPATPAPDKPAPDTPAPDRPAAAGPVEPPKASAPAPNVVGRSLAGAREILQRAGFDVARTLYRDDRSQAADLVLAQADMRTSAGSRPAVALTVVARAAVAIYHRPEDTDTARRLLGALTASRAAAGLAIRTFETSAVRPELVARVSYRDDDLAATAADLAKDANAWLEQAHAGRSSLTAAMNSRVVPRTISIGLPDRGETSVSTSGPLPDVRGLTLADARRKLAASGRVTLSYKWFEDRARPPLEVLSQTELPSSTPGSRSVGLEVVGRGTLVVEYATSDRPAIGRLAGDLRGTLSEGVVLRLRAVDTVRKATLGRVVVSDDSLTAEAATIARFMSGWLTKESRRATTVPTVTDRVAAPRIILFGLPSLQ
jgi:hypothetical protein